MSTNPAKTPYNDSKAEDNMRAARGGGPTTNAEDNTPHDVFNTSGNEPVRDKVADPNKGIPVTRYFTKDGTPVEPSSVPHIDGDDRKPRQRDDVIEVVEYEDKEGSVVTHDSLKARQEDEEAGKDN